MPQLKQLLLISLCNRLAATGTAAPGGLAVEDTPQMVLIMMDGAINQNNFPLYRRVFRNRTNPGGCPALGTFFLMHDYANYHQVTTSTGPYRSCAALTNQFGLVSLGLA